MLSFCFRNVYILLLSKSLKSSKKVGDYIMKTIFFERAFGVDIRSFNTTEDVDKFIERRRGKKMRVVEINTHLVQKRGNVFRIRYYDIDGLVDRTLDE